MRNYLNPLLITSALTLTTTTALAESPKPTNELFSKNSFYIGLGKISGSGDEEFSFDSSSESYDMDISATPIKFGIILPNGRFEISYTEIDAEFKDDFPDETFSGFDLDYLFMFSKEQKLSPYILVGLGFYNYEGLQVSYSGETEDLDGIAFNLGAGLTYSLSKNIEIEAGYNYKYISWDEIDVGSYDNVEISEDMTGLYLGINIGF